jgi:hypothetical protein
MIIPPDLPAPLVPLAWLVGTWRGEGQGDYPTIEGFHFGMELEFGYVPGKPYLTHASHAWRIEPDGSEGGPLARETGYWRPVGTSEVEVMLAHPTGIVEIWLGEVQGRRAELRTDAVVRTSTAKPYTAGHRLYGISATGSLGYVFEMAAMDQPIGPHLAVELHRR